MKKKGFTLIELLATIVILLIVVIVSTPSVISMLDKSGSMTKSAIMNRIIDAAKEYTTSYNRNVLNGLTSVGDSSQVLPATLVSLGLIKQSEIDLLEEDTVFVQITLEDNSQLNYDVLFDPALIRDNRPYITLIGDNPLYIGLNTTYVEQGYTAFDGTGTNITSRVQRSGYTFDTSTYGTHTITYTVTDSEGAEAEPVTRTVYVIDNSIPAVSSAVITSNNTTSNKAAKNGNTITLAITFSKTISNTPTVTIGGRPATVTGSGTTRTATYTIPAAEATLGEGNLSINISNFLDQYSNMGDPVTATTSGGYVNYDRTPPTCVVSGGSTSWTNASKVITGTCNDSGSGCVGNISYTYSVATNITNGGPGASGGTGTVSDNAGNTGTCAANQEVHIDKTAPTCASSGGSGSWRNTSLTLIGTCSDTGGSGCVGNISTPFTSNIATTTASPGTVSDNAGNSVTCPANQSVYIDKTPPTCASSGGSGSWRNTSLTLIGTCSDTGGSGCVGNTSTPFTSNTATTTASAGTVSDNAGNTGTCSANQSVYIDTTPPAVPTVNLNGYTSGNWSTSVTTTLSASDALSGLNRYQYSHDNASWADWPSNPWTINWDGQWNFYTRSVDNAGNVSASAAVYTIRIDTSPPTAPSYVYIGGTGNPHYITSLSTTVYSAGTDATEMCISESGSCSAWEAYSTANAVTLGAASYRTTKTVNVWFRDAAGNQIGPYSDSVRYLASSTYLSYTAGCSAYKSSGYNYSTSTSTVIQGSYGSYTSYYGVLFFNNAFPAIRDNIVTNYFEGKPDYDISSVVVTIKSHVAYARTVRLYVGNNNLTPNYTTNAVSPASTAPVAINSASYIEVSVAANALGTWTITNATWLAQLANANAANLFIYRGNDTASYWEGDGALHTTKPTFRINLVPSP